MADPAKALSQNVVGNWFVDSSCIDCDTCRQLAPRIFGDADGHAFVQLQPTPPEEQAALLALVSCPTGSIGTHAANGAKCVMNELPICVDGDVFYCGFTSPKSYGGSSYFIHRPGGNWMIDSPKFLPQLVRRFEALGGLQTIFLTHRDDVADAAKFAEHFHARRIIHRLEVKAQPGAECVVEGFDSQNIEPDFQVIPTPGHTAGHLALLYKNRYLFTGDHLAWDRTEQRLTAFRDYCWHSWSEQQQSLARLLEYSFEWVLPGHGQRVHLPAAQMRQELTALVSRNKAAERS